MTSLRNTCIEATEFNAWKMSQVGRVEQSRETRRFCKRYIAKGTGTTISVQRRMSGFAPLYPTYHSINHIGPEKTK